MFGLEKIGGAAFDLFGPKGGKAERAYATGARYSAQANRMRASIYRDEATGYDEAAALADMGLGYQRRATEITLMQAMREATKVIGGQQADVAGAGFAASGSALDLLRDSEAQAALTREIITTQGEIDALEFQQASKAYRMQAAAARGNAGIADLSAEADTTLAGTYDEMARDARTRQKVGGVLKGISGIAELGMSLWDMGLLKPNIITPGTSGG